MTEADIRRRLAPIEALIRSESMGGVPSVTQTREATHAILDLVTTTLVAVHQINDHLNTINTRERAKAAVFGVPEPPMTSSLP